MKDSSLLTRQLLDGAISKIRIFKLGSLDHKIAPTPTAASTLQHILGANVGGGTTDIIWGPDIEVLETNTDVQRFLRRGEVSSHPHGYLCVPWESLQLLPERSARRARLTTFISLKTMTERLNYVRNILLDFWNTQLRTVQSAMGFRFPAQVEFDYMYLDDPASVANLLLAMADRNIVSDEFVQRHIKARPEVESRRVADEEKKRVSKDLEKISPYHSVDKQYGLQKISLQTGVVSPTQVGVKLQKKKGDRAALDMRKPSGPGWRKGPR